MNFDLDRLIRPTIKALKAYSSAREEYDGNAAFFLDANESPYPTGLNRYPDPFQKKVKQKISVLKKIPTEQIFLGNGSDEIIDLLIRAFCEPAVDEVLIPEPTYGMYAVSAQINNIKIRQVSLSKKFDIDLDKILDAITPKTKLIFLCSPNNPTGNLLSTEKIITLAKSFHGLVIIDEAYIDFASSEGFISQLNDLSNLVILQTFSKAWGLAGIRLGMCFASENIIKVLNRIKPPYNVSGLTQSVVLEQLEHLGEMQLRVFQIIEQRKSLAKNLTLLPDVVEVFPSDANFILVKMKKARKTYDQLIAKGIVVRDRSTVLLCDECLRITIGTPEENETLLQSL